jgi:hypothetical protein
MSGQREEIEELIIERREELAELNERLGKLNQVV